MFEIRHAASLVFAALHILLRQSGEKLAQVAGGDGVVRLFSGQEDLQAGVPASQIGHQLAVAGGITLAPTLRVSMRGPSSSSPAGQRAQLSRIGSQDR